MRPLVVVLEEEEKVVVMVKEVVVVVLMVLLTLWDMLYNDTMSEIHLWKITDQPTNGRTNGHT